MLYRVGFHDIKNPEKEKPYNKIQRRYPVARHGNTDACKFINDDISGVFPLIFKKINTYYREKNESDTEADTEKYISENRGGKVDENTSEY